MVKIATTINTREINNSAFEKYTRLSFWLCETLSPRAELSFSNFSLLRATCSDNSILFRFVAQGLVVKRFGVVFLYGSRTFEEKKFGKVIVVTIFLQEGALEKNSLLIRLVSLNETKHGTNEIN